MTVEQLAAILCYQHDIDKGHSVAETVTRFRANKFSQEFWLKIAEKYITETKSIENEKIAKLYQAGDWLRNCLTSVPANDHEQSMEFCKAIDTWDEAAKAVR